MNPADKHKPALLAVAVGLALAGPGASMATRVESAQLPFPLVPLQRLAEQRGGFVGAEGLRMQLNMNLRQLVYVNEKLYNDISVNLRELTQVTFADMESMRDQVQAQRETIRSEIGTIEQTLGEPAAPASQAPSIPGADAKTPSDTPGSAARVTGTSSAPATTPSTGVTSARADGPRVTSTPATPVTISSAPVAGSSSSTTGVSTNTPPVSTSASSSSSTTPRSVESPPSGSTRASEIAARSQGANTSATGTSASGSSANATTGSASSAPVITQVAANNSVRTASGEPVERTVIIQNGPNNRVDVEALRNLRGGMTIIQNTLNNQNIRHVMEVDVTLSGLRNLRTMELLGGLNLQLRGAGK